MTAENAARSIVDLLFARSRQEPGRLAYSVCGEETTYGALADDVRRAAAALAGAGLAAGDRCALVLPTSLGLIRAIYGIQALRAVPVVVSPKLPAAAIARRLALVGATLAIAPPGLALAGAPCRGLSLDALEGAMRAAAPVAELPNGRPRPEDLAYLQLTSGSTGEPKAAAIPHGTLLAFLEADRAVFDGGPRDVFAGWVPLHHDMGLVRLVFVPLHVGAPAHLLEPSLASLGPWLALMTRVRATITSAPDFAYRIAARVVDPRGIDLRSLRAALSGGEPVRRSTVEAFERAFSIPGIVRPGYGLAEAVCAVTRLRAGEPLRADARGNVSNGRALDGLELKIDADGELLVRGPTVFPGYFAYPAASAGALRDGWLATGDLGAIDADGHLFIVGRKRAIIKRAGVIVAPREVEEAADAVPGVRLSAAVGVAGGAGEDVVVVAEVRPEVDLARRDAIRVEVSLAVARAIGFPPIEVRLVAPRAIPRTTSGKVRYGELRALVESRSI